MSDDATKFPRTHTVILTIQMRATLDENRIASMVGVEVDDLDDLDESILAETSDLSEAVENEGWVEWDELEVRGTD